MIEIIENIIFKDVILAIGKYFISLSIFFIIIAIIIYISEKIGLKNFIFEIKEKIFKDYSYKWKVLFFTYSYFIFG